MTSSMIVLAGIATSGVMLVLLAPLIFRETQRTRLLDRRLAMTRREAMRAVPGSGAQAVAAVQIRSFGPALFQALSMLVPVGTREREKLTRTLRLAGFARPDALSLFLSCKLAFSVLGAGVAALAAQAIGPVFSFLPEGALVVAGGVAGFVIGGIVPEYGVRSLVNRRKRRMSGALPDALDLMTMCLESGLTFERALATVADELSPIEPDLAAEFRVIEAELRVGSNRRSVLQAYQERTDVDGLRDLAMSLIQGDRYGTPLTQSMKNIAEGERVQRSASIAAWATKLPVLMTLPMLLLVMPGIMLLVAGPAVLTAMEALGGLGGVPGGE